MAGVAGGAGVVGAGLLCAALLAGGSAVQAQGIYACTDGKGRKITSDRPIAECIDRPQRELSSQGTVKRIVGPSLTAAERAALEEKEHQAMEVRAAEAEERRRNRALLLRYPTPAVHERERQAALAQVDEVIAASTRRVSDLAAQRKAIDTEYEFYAVDPSKAPPPLKRRLDDNLASVLAQKKFVQNQDDEKKRINQRFDEERVTLVRLWTMANVPVTAPLTARAAVASAPAPGASATSESPTLPVTPAGRGSARN